MLIYLQIVGATLEFVHNKNNYKSYNEDSIITYVDYGNLEIILTCDTENGS